MSLANKITLARAVLIVPILILLFKGQVVWSTLLFAVASAGDVLDGMVARRRGEVTAWGKALDPAADKILYGSLLISFAVLGDVAPWAVVLFFVPQLALGVGALVVRMRAQVVQSARIPGKAAAALTFGAVFLLLLKQPFAVYFLYAGIAATYVAAVDYLMAALRAMRSGRTDTLESPAEPVPPR